MSTIGILLFLTTCNVYESNVPISDPKRSSINEEWLGNWVGLDENEFIIYPIFAVDLQAFNEQEYVASLTEYSRKGNSIRAVSTYKVFNSELKSHQYLNVYPLRGDNDKYLLYVIEEDFTDSIHVRVLTDSLRTEFETPTALENYLINNQEEVESEIWSEIIPFYRRRILTWDYLNKVNKSSTFSRFYDLGDLDEEYFLNLSDNEIDELIIDSKEVQINSVQNFFKNLRRTQGWTWFWKVPRYAVIKLESGKYIKIKYDECGPLIRDLTNDIGYVNVSEEERNF
ncbi:MAG: hypothetical protein AAFY76_01200 [Cyanobacteria bacterium J06649_11]